MTGQTGASGDLAAKMNSLKGSTIQFDKDGKFDMSMGGPEKGTWQATGNNVSMTITEISGMSIDQVKQMMAKNGMKISDADVHDQLTGSMSDDGKTLTLGSPKSSGFKMTFERSPS